MQEQVLFEIGSSKSQPKKENKAQVIRSMIIAGLGISQIEKDTGYKVSYIKSVIKGFPVWKAKHDAKVKLRKASNLLIGQKLFIMGELVEFLRYSKTHIYYVNSNGKIDNEKRENVLEEILGQL